MSLLVYFFVLCIWKKCTHKLFVGPTPMVITIQRFTYGKVEETFAIISFLSVFAQRTLIGNSSLLFVGAEIKKIWCNIFITIKDHSLTLKLCIVRLETTLFYWCDWPLVWTPEDARQLSRVQYCIAIYCFSQTFSYCIKLSKFTWIGVMMTQETHRQYIDKGRYWICSED